MTIVNIFDSLTPVISADPIDTTAVNVGCAFKSSVVGNVVGVRFYKDVTNIGTHVGNLWDIAGNKLGEVTFSGESASGWQEQLFASSIAISANTPYVISYTTDGHFSKTFHFFQSSGYTNGNLYAYANSETNNGRYAVSGTPTFPDQEFNETNYFVDVMLDIPSSGVLLYPQALDGLGSFFRGLQ